MNRSNFRMFRPVIAFFAILSALVVVGRNFFERYNIDGDVVLAGNLLLFLITLLSFYMGVKGMKHPNPHAFVRSLYSSIMIKLFLCIIAAFIYIAVYQKDLNKPALFICMGLYLVYTFIEVSILMKMLRHKES